jgi:AraC-like DNA-binding protein
MRQKMARAASLLLNRELLIKEVAQQIGFEDQYHFSKAFKRIYAVSPDSFRARGRRN